MSRFRSGNNPPAFRGAGGARTTGGEIRFQVVHRHRNVPDGELLADLRRVARLLGRRTLSKSLYDDHGRFCCPTFANRFGSWTAALALVKLGPAHGWNYSREALLEDLRRAARRLKTDRLGTADYGLHGWYSLKLVYRYFDRWQSAVEAAGLVPRHYRSRNDAELFANLRQVWLRLARQPKSTELGPPSSKFGKRAYVLRFGTFRKALDAFERSTAPNRKTKKRGRASARARVAIAHRKTSRTINWRLRYLILRRDHFRCCACGRSPATDRGVQLQVDHKIPWRRGGETVPANLQTLCQMCNGGKSDL